MKWKRLEMLLIKKLNNKQTLLEKEMKFKIQCFFFN